MGTSTLNKYAKKYAKRKSKELIDRLKEIGGTKYLDNWVEQLVATAYLQGYLDHVSEIETKLKLRR